MSQALALEQTEGLLGRLIVAQATTLARSGAYASAETLLRQLCDESAHPDGLDLLAKIYAQQGRFEDAALAWKRTIAVSPGHASATAGLAKIQALRRYPVWLSMAGPMAMLACGVLAFVGLGSALATRLDRSTGDVKTAIVESAQNQTTQTENLTKLVQDVHSKTGLLDLNLAKTSGLSTEMAGLRLLLQQQIELQKATKAQLDKTDKELAHIRSAVIQLRKRAPKGANQNGKTESRHL